MKAAHPAGRGMSPARRRLLGAWALSTLCAAAPVRAARPRRIVVMNWELTETLLALGEVPVGVSLPDWYRRTIVAPPLPAGVADIGLLYQPNFEALQALSPDLLVITPGHAPARRWFERLAPTLTLGAYMSSPTPYASLCAETRQFAARLDRPARAEALIAAADRTFTRVRGALQARAAGAVLVADVVDDRHLRVYGRGSLFDAVLQRIGVANLAHPAQGAAWPTMAGFALIPVQRLAQVSGATLLLNGPIAAPLRSALARNTLWQALPAVRARRLADLPVIAPYGGLVSMQRFADAVAASLQRIAGGGGGLA